MNDKWSKPVGISAGLFELRISDPADPKLNPWARTVGFYRSYSSF